MDWVGVEATTSAAVFLVAPKYLKIGTVNATEASNSTIYCLKKFSINP